MKNNKEIIQKAVTNSLGVSLYSKSIEKKVKIFKLKEEYIKEKETGVGSEIKDDYHTMSELYYNRLILFAVIVNTYKDKAWKSKMQEDESMFPGFFIVGVSTPEGDYSYHYQLKYWDKFNCKELDKAPKYDGHISADIGRLFSLIGG